MAPIKRVTPSAWTPSLSLNYEKLDEQHKTIFATAEALTLMPRDRVRIAVVLIDLGAYIARHFRDEEELMRASHYPDVDMHAETHRAFEREFSAMARSIETGQTALVCRDLRNFVVRWFFQHIKHVDAQMTLYLQK